MGAIKLQNIRTFSFHGCLEEEGKIGSDYCEFGGKNRFS